MQKNRVSRALVAVMGIIVTTASAIGVERPDRAPPKAHIEVRVDQPSLSDGNHTSNSHERTTLRGRVSYPDGSPASNAVVVSSAGGKAVSGDDGRYELRLSRSAGGSLNAEVLSAVRVTAVASDKGTTHVGSRELGSIEGESEMEVPAIVLAAGGTCEPAWLPTFGANPGAASLPPYVLAVYDDGRGGGPALYVGGEFDSIGGVAASGIAKWDGSAWSPLGTGTAGTGYVYAMSTFDDGLGGGPALYVGGDFAQVGDVQASGIAKWDGSSWSALGIGVGGWVLAMTTFDDGSGRGPALYASGPFSTAGEVQANLIAKWDGRSWSTVGSGLNGSALALTTFDDGLGSGPALYAAGGFTTAGGVAANRIARWDGVAWSAAGSGLNDFASALTTFDDGSGSGPALYAAGDFTTAGGMTANRIAKWNGSSWSALGTGLNGSATTLATFDDGSGSGPALYAGGGFTAAGGVEAKRIAKWNGTSWSAVGSGMDGSPLALAVFDRGAGFDSVLFAVGLFAHAGGIAVNGIANWDGSSWSALASGMDGTVYAIATSNDGPGGSAMLYVGGSFTSACGVPAKGVARWDGTTWSALSSGLNGAALSLTMFDDGSGSGPALFVGGEFTTAGGVAANRIAKWDGSAWSALGSGLSGGGVYALTVFDDGSGAGPKLYAGGSFTSSGGVALNRVARWNGVTWAPLGSGLGGVQSKVSALTTFDDGSGTGPSLYAGGTFTAFPFLGPGVARWTGTSWSTVGLIGSVNALASFDDGSGSGPTLCAGRSGSASASSVVRWTGSTWVPVGSGLSGTAYSLAVFDDGTGQGPALYAGGTQLGLTPGFRLLQRWDGQAWSPVGGDTGPFGIIFALAPFGSNAASSPALIAGGNFSVSPAGDSFLALWQGCAGECIGDLDGDGAVGSSDLAIVLGGWGTAVGDLDGDGTTSAQDIAVLLGAWGECP